MIALQSAAAIVFLISLLSFFLIKRAQFTIQKIFGPVLYFGMYKTKLGLKSMDGLAKKFPRTIKVAGYIGVVLGFAGMILIAYSLIDSFLKLLFVESAVSQVALVLPFKVKGGFYVPFLYWIISIFVIATIHEFAHGVVARRYAIKIKSSGFAFLGAIVPIIPAAFVEPDEKQLAKKPKLQQMSVYAAGPMANIVLGIVCALLLFALATPVATGVVDYDGVVIKDYTPGNHTYPAEKYNLPIGDKIIGIDDYNIVSVNNFTDVLLRHAPGDQITVITHKASFDVTLDAHPENNSKAYMGIFLEQGSKIKDSFANLFGKWTGKFILWFLGLLYWLYLLNIGIGLFNLLPLGPIDGGRMLQQGLYAVMKKKLADSIWKYTGLFFLLLIIVNIAFAFIR